MLLNISVDELNIKYGSIPISASRDGGVVFPFFSIGNGTAKQFKQSWPDASQRNITFISMTLWSSRIIIGSLIRAVTDSRPRL
jgi:hypothetical protein